MDLRQDTYKSRGEDDDKENIDDIMNIYGKRTKKNVAMFPAIFHIITKKDMLSEEGLDDQMGRASALKADGIIDQYFFVSAKDRTDENGIKEFLEGLNDRRLDLMKQEQEEMDMEREKSQRSQGD